VHDLLGGGWFVEGTYDWKTVASCQWSVISLFCGITENWPLAT